MGYFHAWESPLFIRGPELPHQYPPLLGVEALPTRCPELWVWRPSCLSQAAVGRRRARGTLCLRAFTPGKNNAWLVPEPLLSFSLEYKATR